MSLATRLENPPIRKSAFETALDGLPGTELSALHGMAADPAWTNAEIIRALNEEHSIRVSKDTMSAWRRNVTR